jgi:hypothetical protein
MDLEIVDYVLAISSLSGWWTHKSPLVKGKSTGQHKTGTNSGNIGGSKT